jgi:hypothetical protein
MNAMQAAQNGIGVPNCHEGPRVTIVLPTRNRPELAISTIRSLLGQLREDALLFVSDNSTSAHSLELLRSACEAFDCSRLHYQVPPQPLPMAEHWEWAIAQALGDTSYCPTHLMIATDRMLFYRQALLQFHKVLRRFPNRVICYNNDSLVDLSLPLRLERRLWSGKLLDVSTKHLLQLSAEMRGLYHVPRLMNCAVPRRVLQAVQARYGSICRSLSPDYAFGYRCLGLEDTITFYDRSLVIFNAHARSNGTSMSRGVASPDSADFAASHGGTLALTATPAPGVVLGTNAMIHEYCLAKAATPGERFPDLDLACYLQSLQEQVECMDPSEVKQGMKELLRSESQRLLGSELVESKSKSAHSLELGLHRRNGWLTWLKQLLKSPATKSAWFFLANRFGIKPPNYIDFEFRSREQAMEFANKFPLPRQRDAGHLQWLVGEKGRVADAPVVCESAPEDAL